MMHLYNGTFCCKKTQKITLDNDDFKRYDVSMMMRIALFLIDVLTVIWVIAVIGYIVFSIQWKRGKVKINMKDK